MFKHFIKTILFLSDVTSVSGAEYGLCLNNFFLTKLDRK